jgi:hypothetical protein
MNLKFSQIMQNFYNRIGENRVANLNLQENNTANANGYSVLLYLNLFVMIVVVVLGIYNIYRNSSKSKPVIEEDEVSSTLFALNSNDESIFSKQNAFDTPKFTKSKRKIPRSSRFSNRKKGKKQSNSKSSRNKSTRKEEERGLLSILFDYVTNYPKYSSEAKNKVEKTCVFVETAATDVKDIFDVIENRIGKFVKPIFSSTSQNQKTTSNSNPGFFEEPKKTMDSKRQRFYIPPITNNTNSVPHIDVIDTFNQSNNEDNFDLGAFFSS